MNNKGQTLVLFVIMLPVLLGIIGYAVDSSTILYEKNKLDNINKSVINYGIKNSEIIDTIKLTTLINKNDDTIIVDNIQIGESITINISKKIDSIFGRILGFNNYDIKSSMTMEIE